MEYFQKGLIVKATLIRNNSETQFFSTHTFEIGNTNTAVDELGDYYKVNPLSFVYDSLRVYYQSGNMVFHPGFKY